MADVHRFMARLNSKRIRAQRAEQAGTSADGLADSGDVLDLWEMPAAGSSFHWSIVEDSVRGDGPGDLEALLGGVEVPHPVLPVSDPDPEGEAGGDEAGTAHYY